MTGADIEKISAEYARSLTDRIKVAVDGTWLLIQEAYTTRAWAALGYASWDDYCTREFGTSRLRLPREERQEVVASLREIGMSTRAIAAATGLSKGSVGNSLAAGAQFWAPAARRATSLDQALRENDIHPEEAEDEECDAVTGQVATNDVGPAPEPPAPRPITGTDGKTYAKKSRPAPQRPPLPGQFTSAAAELGRVIARIERLQTDDRYRANRATIANQCLPEVRRAASVLHDLLSDLAQTSADPS